MHSSPAYDYEMLCSDISNKKLIPIVGHLKAHSRKEFGNLITHDGEEVIYVLSGRVELHTEFYKPLVLDVGDCVFFDSRMGHACIATGDADAKISVGLLRSCGNRCRWSDFWMMPFRGRAFTLRSLPGPEVAACAHARVAVFLSRAGMN